jgi:hypothetical protein
MTYNRTRDSFDGLGFAPGVLDAALANPSDPAATWCMLRELCRHSRFNRWP